MRNLWCRTVCYFILSLILNKNQNFLSDFDYFWLIVRSISFIVLSLSHQMIISFTRFLILQTVFFFFFFVEGIQITILCDCKSHTSNNKPTKKYTPHNTLRRHDLQHVHHQTSKNTLQDIFIFFGNRPKIQIISYQHQTTPNPGFSLLTSLGHISYT